MSTPSFPVNGSEVIDLQQQVARLQALLEAARQVHSSMRLEEILNCVLQIVVRELEMPGALFTVPWVVYGSMPPEPWDGCARFPIKNKEGKRLTELVVALPSGRSLSIYEEDFLQGLALQASVAIENAHYHQRNLEWARVQQDLDSARILQRSLLPQQMPDIAGYNVAVRYTPCYEVGGDYVDIVSMPNGSQIMVVADVAGKGLASAIVSNAFRSAFRAMAIAGVPLVELAAQLNDHHWAEGPEARRRYVTAIFLKLNLETNQLQIVNAGHNPGFLVMEDGTAQEIEASGTPIGLMPAMQYHTVETSFPPGSRLLFYTDGLTEVFHGDEEFGQERLMAAFRECNSKQCADILDSLWDKLHGFSGGGVFQHDDMSALALMRIKA